MTLLQKLDSGGDARATAGPCGREFQGDGSGGWVLHAHRVCRGVVREDAEAEGVCAGLALGPEHPALALRHGDYLDMSADPSFC